MKFFFESACSSIICLLLHSAGYSLSGLVIWNGVPQWTVYHVNEFLLISHGHKSTSSIKYDYCDGDGFNRHPPYSVHANALQVFLHFDELEVCNSIGSKAKIHKLGMFIRSRYKLCLTVFHAMHSGAFYYTLGNLTPKYLSRLAGIQLLALVKSMFMG